jgi:hypothetical protein
LGGGRELTKHIELSPSFSDFRVAGAKRSVQGYNHNYGDLVIPNAMIWLYPQLAFN